LSNIHPIEFASEKFYGATLKSITGKSFEAARLSSADRAICGVGTQAQETPPQRALS
jgi:hypothetical protein